MLIPNKYLVETKWRESNFKSKHNNRKTNMYMKAMRVILNVCNIFVIPRKIFYSRKLSNFKSKHNRKTNMYMKAMRVILNVCNIFIIPRKIFYSGKLINVKLL
jgi:hypothetical protein